MPLAARVSFSEAGKEIDRASQDFRGSQLALTTDSRLPLSAVGISFAAGTISRKWRKAARLAKMRNADRQQKTPLDFSARLPAQFSELPI
jgi:hypothetical protein